MSSGIGPEDHLRNKGITPVHDLPAVGNYLVCFFRILHTELCFDLIL